MDWSKLEDLKERLKVAYEKEDYVSEMSLITNISNEVTYHAKRISGGKPFDLKISGHDSFENLTINLGVSLSDVGRRVYGDLEKFMANCPINGYVYELGIYAQTAYVVA
ncbi:MAG TPA: hypothetical protein P5277_02645 [Candidatus Paceibacterota bacterium]|nr:hypothetical protein [Candidatus Paceibacterota bacterium]